MLYYVALLLSIQGSMAMRYYVALLLPAAQAFAIPAPALARCAASMLSCSDYMVAAAAILGENQCQDENPGALSAAGGSIANAGRDLERAAQSLGELSWEGATAPLADAASSLYEAAAGLGCDAALGADLLDEAAAGLEEGSTVSGCIMLAAAAGPELASSGDCLTRAASSLRDYSLGLAEGRSGSPRGEAGSRLAQASAALEEAGSALRLQGELLEEGRALDDRN